MIRAARWLLVLGLCTGAFLAARPWRQIADGLTFVLAGAVLVAVLTFGIVGIVGRLDSRFAQPRQDSGVTVCDGNDANGHWHCANVAFVGEVRPASCVTYAGAGRTLCNQGPDTLDCEADSANVVCTDVDQTAGVSCQDENPDGTGFALVRCAAEPH